MNYDNLPSWWPSDKPWIIQDCLEGMKSIPDKAVDLLIVDPPYNENKAEWDNVDNYIHWWQDCLKQFVRILKQNGVFYFFQMNIETAMNMHRICKENGLILRQMITIDKGLASVAGRTSNSLRSFPKATEYLFYYTFEDTTGSEQLSDAYQKINPMAKYLEEEFIRAGVTQGDLRKLFLSNTNRETGCITNWVKGYNFPLEWQYDKLREYLNRGQKQITEFLRRDYEDLRRDYEDLRRDYEDLRYTFNLPYGITDVWQINFYEDIILEHETPKPTKVIERIISASSKVNDLVLDPFLGSGTTLLACRKTGRIGLGFEINPECESIIRERSMADVPELKGIFDWRNEPEPEVVSK